MAKRENVSVSFTPQQVEFLSACVASGRYQSTSEVVREAVRLLEDQQARRQAELERVRELVRIYLPAIRSRRLNSRRWC